MSDTPAPSSPRSDPAEAGPLPPWLRGPSSLIEKFAVPEPEPVDSGVAEEGELFPLPGDPPPRTSRSPSPPSDPGVEVGPLGWPTRIPMRERALAILAGALATLAVVLTPGDYGLTWDEAYYYQPALDAVGWLAGAVALEPGWHSREAVALGFERVWELPPAVKFANGTAWAIAAPWVGELRAIRLPSAIAFGLTVSLIYMTGWLAYRRAGAMAGAIVFATLPRVFGHAHLAASETLTTFMLLLVVYAFLRGLQSWTWSLLCAVFFALALVTKVNAVFLPLILLPWAWLHARQASVNILYAWMFLTPPLVLLFWPWLWHDTIHNVLRYIDFAALHPKLGLWFEGTKWNFGAPPAPWYYPLKITLVSTPPLTVVAVVAGALLSVLRWKRTNRIGRLILWAAVVLLGMASLPTTPKYDGIRLFLPAMPFLALLAAGFITRVARLGVGIALPGSFRLTGRQLIVLGTTLTLGMAGAFSVYRSHPRELSYFNSFVGGIQGADRSGYEVAYWGESVNAAALSEINRLLPPHARLKPLAIHDLSLRTLQQWGKLRSDIRIVDRPPIDAFLLQYRKGFWGRTERALYEDASPVAIWDFETVPLLMLYIVPPTP